MNSSIALAATTKLEGVNLALFGMAALDEVADKPGCFRAAPNATLINEGVIEIHIAEVVKKYRDLVKKDARSQEGKYRFIKVFALLAGKDSMVINNGVIKIYCDYEKDEETPAEAEAPAEDVTDEAAVTTEPEVLVSEPEKAAEKVDEAPAKEPAAKKSGRPKKGAKK